MNETIRLVYAATARCPCGAGLAYRAHDPEGIHGSWDCSDILRGRAIPKGDPGSKQHTDRLPFAFYNIKSEGQTSANGATTRPDDDPWTDADRAWDRDQRTASLRKSAARDLDEWLRAYVAKEGATAELGEIVPPEVAATIEAAKAALGG